ncbi:D-erythronate dehydrogenase [Pseudonocardia lacus]|uniref:D-erythronate dehydrogenase n=1 Tax=Pseudonocardia lacus TaxID=2835865 RepID=UPI002028D8A3|nr:D-erythronate dehydrogenase [Pseudonocardia lacus]
MGIRVVVTGGAGFLGALLARELLAGPLAVGGAEPADVDEVVLVDVVEPPADVTADARARAVVGDLATALDGLADADAVFHLAGVVSGAAEADFDLGMRTNLDGTRAVLEWARAHRVPPVLVFTSSLAVFGSDPAIGPIGDVDDDTLPRPQSSYGVQKFIGEQLVADYTRKGFVRGRSVRLMTVSVRPGKPNAAASGFLSGMVREPLAGQRAACPVPADTPVALSSPRRSLEGILRAAAVDDATWGSRTAVNLPALSTTPAEMAAALERVAGPEVAALIDWTDDPAVARIVRSWPARFRTDRARRLGLEPERSFDDIVRAYLADNPPAAG